MNDPHVVALQYRIEHGPGIDWSKASPLHVREDAFDVRIEDQQVRFTMKAHFATESEARNFLEDYIRNWELEVALTRGPNAFRLRFEQSSLIDRNPAPHAISLRAQISVEHVRANVDIAPPAPPSYPQPPTGIKRSPDVGSMFHRYAGYREGREPLASMAYFCLTVLEESAWHKVRNANGKRDAAARWYGIPKNDLERVAKLCTIKGGAEARKAEGIGSQLTPQEKRYIESAVVAFIRRGAAVAFDPGAPRLRSLVAYSGSNA